MTAEGHRMSPLQGRPSRAESEDLLDGAGSGPLHELLAAASGPAHREEIVGEDAAVSAFLTGRRAGVLDGSAAGSVSAAGAVSAPDASRPRRRRRSPGRWRTPTGLASALALALASAGVAGGAAALVLSDQPSTASAPAPSAVGAGAVGSRPLPDAVRVAACGAWRAAGPTTSRAADPAFTELVVAAGGAENVDGFCAAPASPTGEPSPTASPERPEPATSTPEATPSASPGGRGPAGSDAGSDAGSAGSAPTGTAAPAAPGTATAMAAATAGMTPTGVLSDPRPSRRARPNGMVRRADDPSDHRPFHPGRCGHRRTAMPHRGRARRMAQSAIAEQFSRVVEIDLVDRVDVGSSTEHGGSRPRPSPPSSRRPPDGASQLRPSSAANS